jgi:hypothetical protein
LSNADRNGGRTDFDRWFVDEFTRTGAFTALTVLVEIGETQVTPLCSTYFNVIGGEVGWHEIVAMLAGSGKEWDGAAFFPIVAADGGPLDNPTAQLRLRDLEGRVDDDRLVLNEGHFFDKWGRRMKIEEVVSQ